MATLTITVRNTLRLYGVEPHNKWGTLVWGTDTWAQQDVQWKFDKSITDNLSVDSSQQFKVKHPIYENIVIDSIVSRKFSYKIYESINLSSSIAAVYRINNGWYVKRGDDINTLEFPKDNFTEVTTPSTSWTQVTTPATVWTQL